MLRLLKCLGAAFALAIALISLFCGICLIISLAGSNFGIWGLIGFLVVFITCGLGAILYCEGAFEKEGGKL